MLHAFRATKDIFPLGVTITQDVKPLVKKGEIAIVIETPLSIDVAVQATQNGSAELVYQTETATELSAAIQTDAKSAADEAIETANKAVKAAQANAAQG